MRIVPHETSADEEWDAFVAASTNGTLLHSRRYLRHQGNRFEDVSVVARDERGRLVAVFPAALDPGDSSTVVSHPGVTYGGLVIGDLGAADVLDVIEGIAVAYQERGAVRLRYKAIPRMYHRAPAEADLYALFRLGALRYRCDVSACIDLDQPLAVSRNRLRRRRAAEALGLQIRRAELHDVEALWDVVIQNRLDRYNVAPTHTAPEVRDLMARLPDQVVAHAATNTEGEILASGLSFLTPRAWHTQYLAASARGFEAGAQDLLVFRLIEEAREGSYRYFDFGISNEDQGRVLNDTLHRYKEGFGAGAVVHEFYEIEFTAVAAP